MIHLIQPEGFWRSPRRVDTSVRPSDLQSIPIAKDHPSPLIPFLLMYFSQPALPSGKAPLSNLSKLRDVAAIGCNDEELAIRQTKVYDWFEMWNDLFFGNRLRPVHINVSLTGYGAFLGLCYQAPVHFIEIHPQCWKGGADHKTFGSTDCHPASLVVLHEMIHLAEIQTLGTIADKNCHLTPTWSAWCNYIAEQVNMPLTFGRMKRGKAKADSDGVRANVWKHPKNAIVRTGTRLANYDETRCFPFLEDDQLMQENKEIRTIKGKEVEQLPSL